MTTEITLSVPDISCNHCKSSIEGALVPLDGVEMAEVSIDERKVAVRYDDAQIGLDKIVQAIDDQGYEVAKG
jgi:copper chaperone